MRTTHVLIGATTALLLLAGCGGSGGSDESAAGASANRPASGTAGEAPGAGGGSGEKAPGEKARDEKSDVAGGGTAAQAQQVRLAPVTARAIIYTANLRVQAKDVSDAASRAKQMVSGAGGYVENETATSDPVGATITFRIPSERYATVLEQLGGQLGTRVSQRQQAQDVSQEVADVDSRVKSAEAALVSFRKLLDRANTVGEVLNVEQELSRREADLESLQARQKTLAQQTSFGTVTLQLEAPAKKAAVAEADSPSGFVGGLKAGWDVFTDVLSGLALALGWLLPFLAVAALIALPAWRFRRPIRGFFERHSGTARPASPE
jgi:hypothetical protein